MDWTARADFGVIAGLILTFLALAAAFWAGRVS